MTRRSPRRSQHSSIAARHATMNRWVHTQGEAIPRPDAAYAQPDRNVEPAVALLAALCWCGRTSVWVPQADVTTGRTLCCGSSRCAGPDGDRTAGDRVPKGSKGAR